MAEYNFFNVYQSDLRKPQFFRLYLPLLQDDIFISLSLESKIAYSLFENRHQSSVENESGKFKDENGRYFIFFSRQELVETLNCSTHKAAAIMKELIDFGLIERSSKLGNNFSGNKGSAQYRLYVNDYVDFIKMKAKKKKSPPPDQIETRRFIRIYYSLFDKNEEFFNLPITVKVTYSILLDQSMLSFRNDKYQDSEGNVFIKFPIKKLQTWFGGELVCSQSTAIRYLNRLEKSDMIQRKRLGATEYIIYVFDVLNLAGSKTCTSAGSKTCTSAGSKTCTSAGSKTCTQAKLNNNYNNIAKQEIRQLELEEENFQFQTSVTTAKAAYRAEIYERFEFEDTLRLYSETLNYPEDMMKKFTAIFKAILNLIVWVKFIDEEINCGVLKVSSSDFSNAVEQLESSDVERIIFTIINSGIEYNNNYLLTSLYFATLTRSNVYET